MFSDKLLVVLVDPGVMHKLLGVLVAAIERAGSENEIGTCYKKHGIRRGEDVGRRIMRVYA